MPNYRHVIRLIMINRWFDKFLKKSSSTRYHICVGIKGTKMDGIAINYSQQRILVTIANNKAIINRFEAHKSGLTRLRQ